MVTVGTLHASDAVGATGAGTSSRQSRSTLAGVLVNTGAVTSAVQVTVLDAVEVLPQKSLAVNVLVCERPHPSLLTGPSLEDTVGTPHASVAVAVPSALLISLAAGLHARVVVVPPVVSTGAVTSAVHVTVLDAVEVLPQKSLAVNVLVCERLHPLLVTLPSLEDTVGTPQASVAVAVPSALLISLAAGLHPSVVVVPPVVSTGAVRSAVHVTVLDAVEVLPQKSLAVNVLVCERLHPLLLTLPSLEVTVGTPHASVAVAVPRALLISLAAGLHPSVVVVPPVVSTGAVRSAVHVTVLDAVEVLPQKSLAVNVLVCERLHPLLLTLPSLEDTVGTPQASVAVAVPSALLISLAAGLHPRVVVVPPVVSTGAVRSAVQVTVLDAVEVLPQKSIAVNVLVCERAQPLLLTGPSPEDTVGVPQASVEVAVPNALLISPADGLQPNVVVVPPVVSTGAVTSAVHVTVLEAVEVLPQKSLAVNVLVCERLHPLLLTLPSLEDTVGTPQASVAVAVPRALLISLAAGLHPSVVVVPPVVSTGAVRSAVHVTVLEAVEVLPQKSLAVNVLVCERLHPLLLTLPSLVDTVGTPHASVAVAVPRALLISLAAGLHPSVVVVPPVVSTGAVTSAVHVTVLDAVEVLPQKSLAVNVLVCERLHPLLLTLPSLEDTVGTPQASVAVAVPSALLISLAAGLHPSVVVVPPVVSTGAVRSAIHVTVLESVAILPQKSVAVNVLV